jgi:hypothetical protein
MGKCLPPGHLPPIRTALFFPPSFPLSHPPQQLQQKPLLGFLDPTSLFPVFLFCFLFNFVSHPFFFSFIPFCPISSSFTQLALLTSLVALTWLAGLAMLAVSNPTFNLLRTKQDIRR